MLGPNGAGKTTMLQDARHAAADRRRPAPRSSASTSAASPHVVRQLLGVTGQYASVDENLTATENLVAVRPAAGPVARRGRARPPATLLEQFGLERRRRPSRSRQFSGGMRRRLDLAASLITRPPLIFLDEPTTGLDPRTRGQMWDTIREPGRGRLHGAADHAVPRRGRPARRPDRGDRPRPQGRRGHARRAEGLGRRLDAAAAARRPAPTTAPRRRGPPACSARSRCSTPEAGRHQRRRSPTRDRGRRRADRACASRHRRSTSVSVQPSRPSTRCSWPSPATTPASPTTDDDRRPSWRSSDDRADHRPRPSTARPPSPHAPRTTCATPSARRWPWPGGRLKKMRRNPEQFFDVTHPAAAVHRDVRLHLRRRDLRQRRGATCR